MRTKTLCKKLLVAVVAVALAIPPITASMPVNAENSQQSSYYQDWSTAEAAVIKACGIQSPDKYTETQADLIVRFLNEWTAKVLETLNEDEANSVLSEAKTAFEALNLDDEEAMEDHAQLIAAREAAVAEKTPIMNANIANGNYTKASRTEYENAARASLTAMYNAESMDTLNAEKANFDSLSSILVELSADLIAAKEAAKRDLNEYRAECENITVIDSYLDMIDNADTVSEINQAVTDGKAYLLNRVNANIDAYIDAKLDKIIEKRDSYKDELGDKFTELNRYVNANINQLFSATTKDTVDSAYSTLIGGIENKVVELKNGTTNIPVTGISLNKNSAELKVNDTVQLTATVSPDNATNKTVIWSVDNASIASVDSNGLVTAKAAGTATITAQASNFTATCTVTVTKNTASDSNQGNSNTGSGNTNSGSKNDVKEDNNNNSSAGSANTVTDIYSKASVANANGIDGLVVKYTKLEIPDLTAYRAAIGNTTVACFFDVTAWINGKNGTELGREISFTIDIPSEFLKDGRTFYLIRNHEGKITRLNDIDNNANTITVKSSDFSGYLLTYTDSAVNGISPKTGDNSFLVGYMAVAVVSLAGIFFASKKIRKA